MTEPLSPAELTAYLARIGYTGPLKPDLAALTALHAAHQHAIPFENLEVQFGRIPTLDPDAAFAKLVTRRRGGWCYEQNGLLGRALTALGFKVTRLSAGVLRQLRGDMFMGSHLALLVHLERDYLADVGFGGGVAHPIPLAEGWHPSPPIASELSRADDGYWRLGIALGDPALSYDFHAVPADEAELARLCHWQATDPDSIFVQNLVVQQRKPEAHVMLRGKVLIRTTTQGADKRELGSGAELISVLRDAFGLDVPEAAGLWEQTEARHTALFASEA
jgi:N-hydroxyarylamine O-acetyltransferase